MYRSYGTGQVVSGIHVEHSSMAGMHMIKFDKPILLEQLFKPPVQYHYVRIPFYAEVLKEIQSGTVLMSLSEKMCK